MADATLNSIIIEHQALQFTLRDDLARYGAFLSGDHLTTVMGPAYKAGVKEPAETVAQLNEDSVLNAMLQNVSDKAAAMSMIAKLIGEVSERAAKAAVAEAIIQVDKQVVTTVLNLTQKAQTTVTQIEAVAKKLLAGAEAKANVLTRKREEAQVNFHDNLEFVRMKTGLISKLDKRLEQMTADLNAVSTDMDAETEEMYKRISQISNGQKALANQKDIAKQQMVTHFGDQVCAGKSTKELITLTIPENMEDGKGKELMNNLEGYINGRAEQFYALMPYLLRMLEDYDHTTGACFKPPCIQEKLTDIPEEIRSCYTSQSKNLYVAITAKLSDQVKSLAKASFEYGVDDTSARCAENDGPNLIFALICMFRPCNVEYTEELEAKFIDAHHAFHGNDPREVIKELREPLQEAQNLQIPMKWKQSGKRIVDTLIHNDHNMHEALKAFKKIDVADRECTAHLDKLFAAVEAQCRRNDKHEGKANACSLRANSRDAAAEDNKHAVRDRSKVECRFADKCTRRNCPFMHKNKNGKNKKDGDRSKCLGIGCPDKANKFKKLCTTCFMKACEQGEIKLSDGSTFTSHKPGSSNAGISRNQMHELKKAFAAITGADDHESLGDEDADQDAPVGIGGPASSAKRKRANSAKEVDEATKRVKQFAESLGVDFN